MAPTIATVIQSFQNAAGDWVGLHNYERQLGEFPTGGAWIAIRNNVLWLVLYTLLVLFFVQPSFIFLMAQFFKSIPRDLEEAALIDGLGWFGIFWKIILPVARPALVTVAILAFAGAWNDFLDWVIFMQTPNMFNIQLGLSAFKQVYQNQWDLIMAGSVVAILPILIVYVAGSRYFTRGIATTGLK